ncbi:MAG: FAD-dependent oxidoreductase [Elusimicrobiota bacterium]
MVKILENYDVVVIGGGPAGYSSALYARKYGLSVCLIEKEFLGGVCLNRGCMPTKVMTSAGRRVNDLKNIQSYGVTVNGFNFDYKQFNKSRIDIIGRLSKGLDYSLKKSGVVIKSGFGSIVSDNVVRIFKDNESVDVEAKHIIIAAGSKPSIPKFLIGKENVINSEDFWSLESIPQNIAVIGGGVIGCEYASALSALGYNITLIEMEERLLLSEEKDISQALYSELSRSGINIRCGEKVNSIETNNDKTLRLILSKGGPVTVSLVVVCAGRSVNLDGLGLENVGAIDPNTLDRNKLNIKNNIWIAGDIAAGPQLAHKAYYDAKCIIDSIQGKKIDVDYSNMPIAIFTMPEISRVGLTEEEASKKCEIMTVKVNFAEVGKAVAEQHARGFLKLVYEKDSGNILGISIIGYCAGELQGISSVIVQNKMSINDLKAIKFAHPTLSEVFHLAVDRI